LKSYTLTLLILQDFEASLNLVNKNS